MTVFVHLFARKTMAPATPDGGARENQAKIWILVSRPTACLLSLHCRVSLAVGRPDISSPRLFIQIFIDPDWLAFTAPKLYVRYPKLEHLLLAFFAHISSRLRTAAK